MRCHIVATLVTLATLSTTLPLPTAVANECGDVAIFGARAATGVGTNLNAALCVAGGIEAAPTLLTPGSDVVKVRFTATQTDPGSPTITVLLYGLGHDGTALLASRTEGTAGPPSYDTSYTGIDATATGDLTAIAYSLGGTELGRVTYSTA